MTKDIKRYHNYDKCNAVVPAYSHSEYSIVASHHESSHLYVFVYTSISIQIAQRQLLHELMNKHFCIIPRVTCNGIGGVYQVGNECTCKHY